MTAPRVKPLVWEDDSDHWHPETRWRAKDCFGEHYEIELSDGVYTLSHKALMGDIEADALAEAKAAAQADYETRILAALEPQAPQAQDGQSFQARVQPWLMACFGQEISGDRVERGDRLLEEVFELLQSGGYDPARVIALRDYVWSREDGEPSQEVGGVMVTLAAYCLAHGLDMHAAAETELARVWTKVEKIRAKQAAKPVGSALPQAWAPAPQAPAGEAETPVTLTYTNWRGETSERTILPRRVWFGATEWHPEPQWLLSAIDVEKSAERDFALKDFGLSPSHAREQAGQTEAARDVLAERRRQVEVEGWTHKHDDQHVKGEMAGAAACYALYRSHVDPVELMGEDVLEMSWPWDPEWWKPTTRRRDLVKAAALILAEIERLDRATPPASQEGQADG